MNPTLLIPGISGLLGLNLAICASQRWNIVGTTNQHPLDSEFFKSYPYDLRKAGEGKRLVEMTEPNLVVNCVAVANLETSEKEPELAYRLNSELPKEFASICAEMNIPFIQISTDAVFDGKKGNYSESDETNPINTYARTKLVGEEGVRVKNPDAMIARVNFYGWSISGSRSICEFFYNNLRDGNPIKGFYDLLYSPMLASDLATTLLEMAERKFHGIYHVSVNEHLSKYEFGCRLASEFGFDEALIEPVSWREVNFKADRSPDLTMSVDKLLHDLGHSVPGVAMGLADLHRQMNNGVAAKIRQQST